MKILIFLVMCVAAVSAAQDSNSTNELKNILRAVANKLLKTEEFLKNITLQKVNSSKITNLVNRGYQFLAKHVVLQTVYGLNLTKLEAFTQHYAETMNIKMQAQREIISKVLNRKQITNKNGQWKKVLVFTTDNESSRGFIILSRRNNSNFDIVTANVKLPAIFSQNYTTFSISKLTVNNNSILYVNKSDVGVKLELGILMTLAEMAAFKAITDTILPGQTNTGVSSYAVPVMAIMEGISAGLDLYKKAAEVFKTTIKSQIIKSITNRGFAKYSNSIVAMVTERMKASGIEDYKSIIADVMNIPAKHLNGIINLTRMMKFSKKNSWGRDDLMFSVGEGSSCNWLSFMFYINEDDKTFNLMIATLEATFQLAPDIEIVETSRSFVGGIYEDNQLKKNEIPVNLTQEDLEKLKLYFKIMMSKKLAEVAGVPDNTPDMVK